MRQYDHLRGEEQSEGKELGSGGRGRDGMIVVAGGTVMVMSRSQRPHLGTMRRCGMGECERAA
jgi:hypothetical protein